MRQIRPIGIAVFAWMLMVSACSNQPEVAQAPSGSTPAGGAAAPAPAPKPEPPALKTATLAAGTTLSVRTTSTLSTKTNKTGEEFTAVLDAPITEGNWMIADRGATVTGKITTSDPGGRVKGVASMTVALTSLTTADGQRVDLTTSGKTIEAKATKKKDAAKIGIGAGVGAAIGAIAGGGKGAAIGAGAGGAAGTGVVMATRGDPAVIPAETALTFTLRSPVTITQKR